MTDRSLPSKGTTDREAAMTGRTDAERIAVLEDIVRVLLTQNHLGERLPYAQYKRWWDATREPVSDAAGEASR